MYYTTGFRRDEIQDLVAIVRLIQGRLAGYLAAVPTWRNTALHDHPE
ncbi:hypothetical protein [Pseudonocardia sp. ICBG1142]|nr:hypothetical protein [Pseudonocardia sp. ICBG1142]